MVKLSNGEDIICNVEDENGQILIISSPLKMETYNRTTEKGMVESLGLSRWIQPYSDEDEFTIHKNTIVLMTPVSAGLKRYYEYVLKNMEDMIEKDIRVNNEFYVCPVFNQAIEDNKEIRTFDIPKMWGLGTPEDLKYYLENYK